MSPEVSESEPQLPQKKVEEKDEMVVDTPDDDDNENEPKSPDIRVEILEFYEEEDREEQHRVDEDTKAEGLRFLCVFGFPTKTG